MLNGVHGRLYIHSPAYPRSYLWGGMEGEGGIKIFIRQHTDCLTLPCTISPLPQAGWHKPSEFLGFFLGVNIEEGNLVTLVCTVPNYTAPTIQCTNH
jgi:hypothetical protein